VGEKSVVQRVLDGDVEPVSWEACLVDVECPPTFHVSPARAVASYGPSMWELAEYLHMPLDDWQRAVLNDWGAIDEDGRPACITHAVEVPRQNGKGTCLEVFEVFQMLRGRAVLHTAHLVTTGTSHYFRLQRHFGRAAHDPIAEFPELNRLVDRMTGQLGSERIGLVNGGGVQMSSRMKGSARGTTQDVLVFDETQDLSEPTLNAIIPTASAARSGEPEWIYTGTPPSPEVQGSTFTRIRAEARSDDNGRLSWSEWSAPDEGTLDLDDRAVWRATNPALSSGRLSLDAVIAERDRLSDSGFARERLGRWDRVVAQGTRAIPARAWEACQARPPKQFVEAVGVAFSKDGLRFAVAVGKLDERARRVHVYVDGYGSTEGGLGAMADELERGRDRVAMFAMSGRGGSETLVQLLHDRGVRNKRQVHIMTTGDYVTACSMLFDGVMSGAVTHPAPADPATDVLEASVRISDRKPRAGGWGWASTVEGDMDELPLEAVSVAVWAVRTTKRRPGRQQVIMF
jgi:hypothetical protein